jgi:hypothetical protein
MASETGPIDAETQIEAVRIDNHEADVADVDEFEASGSCDVRRFVAVAEHRDALTRPEL